MRWLYFNYDANGNNSIDFGFYDPSVATSNDDFHAEEDWIQLFPIPVASKFTINGNLAGARQFVLYDSFGRKLRHGEFNEAVHTVDISSFPAGLYFVQVNNPANNYSKMIKLIKI